MSQLLWHCFSVCCFYSLYFWTWEVPSSPKIVLMDCRLFLLSETEVLFRILSTGALFSFSITWRRAGAGLEAVAAFSLWFLPIFFPKSVDSLHKEHVWILHPSALAQSANRARYSLCHKILSNWTCAVLFLQLQSLCLCFFSVSFLAQLCLHATIPD